MKKNQKRIQTTLIIVGFLLILSTYFFYPFIVEKKTIVEKNIQEDLSTVSESEDQNTTSFESIEYKGLYDLDKNFIVKSQKAHIKNEEPDIVYMTNMHVILYLNDGRVVNITADEGRYNKANYDIFFNKNVTASDGGTEIFSDNLDLLGNESAVKIYNNVSINYPTGSLLRADNVEYDFQTKYFKISMLDDKRIKMKIVK